jgi:hypothetical protein
MHANAENPLMYTIVRSPTGVLAISTDVHIRVLGIGAAPYSIVIVHNYVHHLHVGFCP